MKLKYSLIFGVLALVAGNAVADTLVFNITGATAFRAPMNQAIIDILGGDGVTKYAYVGTSGIEGSNRAIFVGTNAAFPGDTIIVRTGQNGSTQGIADTENNAAITYLKTDLRLDGTPGIGNPVTTDGYNLGASGNDAAETETAIPQWSFSDVDKLLSSVPNASLGGGPVGVVPFMFLAGEGSPTDINNGINNMTDQLHAALWSTGFLPSAFFTGNTADLNYCLATGRNNGSGTRATILSETGYGSATNVVQYNAVYTGARTEPYPTARITEVTEFGNGGNSSNSGVREILTRDSTDVASYFVSYLTISDALAAIDEGAHEMTYNGVRFSAENVKKGLYTLWGYQQFYLDNDATADEILFDATFRAAIPSLLQEPDAIAIPNMSVTRSGGDGGPIAPNNNYPNP